MADGKKMSKSLGNYYTIEDVCAKGYEPLALRYFYLTAHYRKQINFTWEGLKSAQNALKELRSHMSSFRSQGVKRSALSQEKLARIDGLRTTFDAALGEDMNTPQALAVVWEVVKSNIPPQDKYDLLTNFDEVLGLGLDTIEEIPAGIRELAAKRDQLRKNHQFADADTIRKDIEAKGFIIEDTPQGGRITKA